MARPVWGVRLSLSVALLLPGVVSPGGRATVAVLVNAPVAAGLMVATAVKVAVPPGSRVTVVRMLPLPLAAATLDPAEATAVQLTAVMAAGKKSVTWWAAAALGPVLWTTMV